MNLRPDKKNRSKTLWREFQILAAGIVILGASWADLAYAGEPKRVPIPAGEFQMGDAYCAEEQGNADWCRDETPHAVRLDAYAIDAHEVTNAEYRKCFQAGVCDPVPLHEERPKDFNQGRQPVVFVTWKDAMTYCKWKGGRLPTEAEWERAASGDDPGGAHFGEVYKQGMPRKVGGFNPNSNGLYDMMGNVYEWTLDWYGPLETSGVQENPVGPETGKEKVVRGGSWLSPSHYLRTSDRVAKTPDLRYSDVGFRCVVPAQ